MMRDQMAPYRARNTAVVITTAMLTFISFWRAGAIVLCDLASTAYYVAGIAEHYEPEALVGRRIVVVANLKPAKLMGVESRGMLLAASVDGTPFVLSPDGEVPPGTEVR